MALEASRDELLNLAAKGDIFVKEFLKIFIPYDSIDAARQIDWKTVDNILLRMKNSRDFNEGVTFYHCKYLLDDNSCKNCTSETISKNFFGSPFAVIPPECCAFAGWLFLKREEEKQRIRKAKEELIDLAVLKTKIKNKETLERIESVEKKLNKTIDLYKKYGAEDW